MIKNNVAIKNISIFFAGLISTIAVSLNLYPFSASNWKAFISGNRMIYFLLLILFIILIKKSLEIKNKNIIKYSIISALLLSLVEVLGASFEATNSFYYIIGSKKIFIKAFIEYAGLSVLFYSSFVLMFNFLLENAEKYNFKKENIFLKANKKSFLIIWGIIFLAWCPYFVVYLPGLLNFDSFTQIYSILGLVPFNNHHPIFHTFIIAIFIKIGELFGSLNLGVTLYSLFQMIVMSGIFSFTIYYLNKKNFNKFVRIAALVFFPFFPVNAFYSIIMWKDVLFSGIFLLCIIYIIEMCTNTESFFSKKKNIGILIGVSILIILLRNNGYYALLLTYPLLILFLKKYRKKITFILITCIIFHTMYSGPILMALNVDEGSAREGLSIPLQQIARVVKYHGDELTPEENEMINNILPLYKVDNYNYNHHYIDNLDDIGEAYNPRLSDPVKCWFNDDYYKNNKLEFFTMWAGMFFKYPKEYVKAYISNSFGYWYPETVHWNIRKGIIVGNFKNIDIQPIKPFPQLYNFIIKSNIYELHNVAAVSMIYSIGFNFIVLMLSFVLICIKKRYKILLAYAPILALWLTVTASPVYAEFRYIYPLFISLLLYIGLALKVEAKE